MKPKVLPTHFEPKFDRQKIQEGITLVKLPVRTGSTNFDESDLFPCQKNLAVAPKEIAPPRPDDK